MRHLADVVAVTMQYACAAMRHVDCCGLLNRHWTSRLFHWAVTNGTEP